MKVHFTSKKRIHFMGIGGSGMSGAAALAKAYGYEIDGCDLNVDTPYIEKLKKEVDVFEGHSPAHLKDSRLLVVTPAVYFDEPHPEEFLQAENKMTWQEFMGKYLQKGKEVVAVAGTHGKSTTTAMLSLIFESAGMDPSVMVGAKVPSWGKNYRAGKGDTFIVESDEFFDSFLHYTPSAIILNNIEFDHPDYFKTKTQLLDSFKKHIDSLVGKKILIANIDSPHVKKIAESSKDKKIITCSLVNESANFLGKIVERNIEGTKFLVDGEEYTIKLTGDYNVANALGVIAMASEYRISKDIIKKVLSSFTGIGRRMELIGESEGVKIYDDYAHHPTAIKETLKGLRQKHEENKIIAIVEPHSYSRTKALLSEYNGVFEDADEVIIAPIFKARDTETFGINENSIVAASSHKNICAIDSFDKIAEHIKSGTKKGNVVIVMGAGKSHELARKLLA